MGSLEDRTSPVFVHKNLAVLFMSSIASQPGTVPIVPSSEAYSTEHPEISIVMPCLNEADTLETCIKKAMRSLQENGIHGEVIVGDNGSDDGRRTYLRPEG